MQGREGKGHSSPPLPPAQARSSRACNDGTLNAIVHKSVCSLDSSLPNAAVSHEDEALSWLHYPVEDPLDRGYCSDFFGDFPADTPILRPPFNQDGSRSHYAPSSATRSIFCGLLSQKNAGASSMDTRTAFSESTRDAVESCGSGPAELSCRVAGADAVVAGGANQAADFTTSHMELEVLSKLDSEGEALSKAGNLTQTTCNRGAAAIAMLKEASQAVSQGPAQQQASFTGLPNPPYPTQKAHDVMNFNILPMGSVIQTASNFTIFSSPVVEARANLHKVGESSGLTNVERVRQQTGQQGIPREVSVLHAIPTTYMDASHIRWLPPPGPPPLPLPTYHISSVESGKNVGVHVRWPPPLPPPLMTVSETREGANPSKETMSMSRMSVTSSEMGLGTADQTATSPSRCSASSTDRSIKVTDLHIKNRRTGGREASDYQSEDVSEMANVKKSSSSSKRMRTAEMHNQSERKRRVKINDKLKTLQELIPNGNKPDKASLLDAVIEYVKLLQAQLQAMSMRTGLGIPSWMIPNVSMQHVQIPAAPQMRLSAEMGMGVGVGMGMRMGMGMGMMDANAAIMRSGLVPIPLPVYPGQAHIVHPPHPSAFQPAEPLQASSVVNAPNIYVAPSHVQQPPMNQNISMYNAYIPQPQLQAHPWPQPQQQQQFQAQMQQSQQTPQLGNTVKKPSQ